MPVVATARLVSTVIPSGDRGATLLATVEEGQTPATLLSTITRGRVDACEATCIRTGFKVKLGGSWLPDADLVDAEHSWQEETPVEFLTLTLIGGAARQYASLATLDTWTQVPIEYWVVNGPPGQEREELRLAGYVRPGSADEKAGPGGPGFVTRIQATNRIGRFADFDLCREIEPLSGFNRGEILTELFADAGLTAVDFPAGEVYTKGIVAKNTKLLAFAQAFIEPEGWNLREIPRPFADGGPIVVARLEAPAAPPQAPDDRWDLSDVPSTEIRPPSNVPSRYITRGYGAVFVDEHGQETKVTVTEVEELYAPKVATHYQDASGVITPTGFPVGTAALRVTQRTVQTEVSRGGKLISGDVAEFGWKNPRAAKQISFYNGPGDSGYNFVIAFIDETGEFVQHTHERFMETSRRKLAPHYDQDENLVGATTQVFRHYLRTMGVTLVGAEEVTVNGAYIFGDSNSYSSRFELYGLAEEHEEEREFDDTTGAEGQVTVASFGFVALRSYVGPGSDVGYFIRSDGHGQAEIVASWRQYAESFRRNVVVDGTLQSTYERQKRLDTYRMLSGFGLYQWGDFDSLYKEEVLLTSEVRTVQYRVLSDGSYERTILRPGVEPVAEILSGRVPQVRYKSSAWTFLRQTPIELIVDDPGVEALFGFRREVIQNDHVQSQAEAERVLANRRRRARTYRVRLSRHETHNRLGATVFLVRPDQALAHRGWLVEGSERRSRTEPSQQGSYAFEVAWS